MRPTTQKSLNEELKRFKLISEYTFYTEEPKDDTDDLLLGASEIAEVDDDPNDVASAGADAEASQGGDDSKTANPEEPAAAAPDAQAQPQADAGVDMGGDTSAAPTAEIPAPDAQAAPEPSGDEVEVDVTSLVQGSEEAKNSADKASHKTSVLLSKFQELEKKVTNMAAIGDKIENLEKELVKRNPTPIESLEMRSLSSFPYNIKLTDYWNDVEGYNPKPQEEKEYVLTQDDVNGTFSDATIKKSFDETPQEYEEEDI